MHYKSKRNPANFPIGSRYDVGYWAVGCWSVVDKQGTEDVNRHRGSWSETKMHQIKYLPM